MSLAPQARPDFLDALEAIETSHRRDKNKAAKLKFWFDSYFSTSGRGSIVTESKQVSNRVTEQFRHGDSHVVFMYYDSDTLDPLKAHAQNKVYPSLTTLAFAKINANYSYDITDVWYDAVTDPVYLFYKSAFPGAKFVSLAYLKPTHSLPASQSTLQPSELAIAAEVDWDELSRAQPPNDLVGLELPFRKAAAALRSGKHIVFLGPPGTGKTRLAKTICNLANVDYMVATATSEWTTFETIGGYIPKPGTSGVLDFNPALILSSVDANQWLIIDELNRADIDKAFGEMFTVFSGSSVKLPYKVDHGGIAKEAVVGYSIRNSSEQRLYELKPDWRLIGTMNTFDKASLHQMSYAFMRRFAFIDVGIPSPSEYRALLDERVEECEHLTSDGSLKQEIMDFTFRLFASETHGLGKVGLSVGPAIPLDIIRYVNERFAGGGVLTPKGVMTEAVESFLYPQFEGKDDHHEEIVSALSECLGLTENEARSTSILLSNWTGFVSRTRTKDADGAS